MFYGLGGNIDVILRENYRSVLAVERMKEALERMDSGLIFAASGRGQEARAQFDKSKEEFDRQLAVEQGNITLPGERELVDELTSEYGEYLKLATEYFDVHATTLGKPRGLLLQAAASAGSRTSSDWKRRSCSSISETWSRRMRRHSGTRRAPLA